MECAFSNLKSDFLPTSEWQLGLALDTFTLRFLYCALPLSPSPPYFLALLPSAIQNHTKSQLQTFGFGTRLEGVSRQRVDALAHMLRMRCLYIYFAIA